jgi:hypothetical protein
MVQAAVLALTFRCAMTSPNFSGYLGSEFEPFLSSPLWLERNESTLSVMSALARLDIDPWAEAAALATLSKAAAVTRLAALLGPLPGAPAAKPDREGLCQRALSLLPSPYGAARMPALGLPMTPGSIGAATSNSAAKPTAPPLLLIGWLVIAGLIGASILPRLIDHSAATPAAAVTQTHPGPTVHGLAMGKE